MKKMKDKLLKGISSIIGVISLLLTTIMVLNTEVFATEKTYYEGDYTPPWGKISIQGAEEKNNINYVTSDEVVVEIYAKDDKCTPKQISYYLSTTPISDVGKITNWSTYSEGATETLSFKEIAGENKTVNIYAVFKDYNGNISHKYSGTDYEQTITYDMNTTDETKFATGINTKRIYGMPFAITSQIPKREGYTFLGWSTDSAVKTPSYEGADIVPADVALGTNQTTATLYAIWLSNNAVDVPNLGNVEMSNPNAELTYDPDSGELGGAVPPAPNEPETPEEIPEENLPKIIEFGYGTFESKTEYTPGEYETVEYETTYTETKYPVSYQNVVWSQWMVTKDEEGNVISTEPGNITLADIEDQYSTYIVYDFETEEALEANGVKGDSVELWTIYSSSEDTLENAVYLAAYLNKSDGKTTRHIAMWNGSQYVEYDADAAIAAVNTFTETYTVTETKQVQITAPSSSTTHVYIPVGNLKAESGMTWAQWLASEYNTTGEKEPTIKTSDYVDVSYDAKIVAEQEYGFAVEEAQLLADVVQIGDYVNYGVEYENVSNSSLYLSTLTGWRVIGKEGDTVKLVSAGVPLTYYHSYETDGGITSANQLTNNFFDISIATTGNRVFRKSGFDSSKSLSTIFKENEFTALNGDTPIVRAMNKEDIFGVTGHTSMSTGRTMDLANSKYNNLFTTGASYWLASPHESSTSFLWSVYRDGGVGYSLGSAYGVRPVVSLKSGIKATGQDANGVWQISF